jgi:N-acetylmuramoyl-L-alanine amidase
MKRVPLTALYHLPILEHGKRPETKGIVIHVNEGTFDGTIGWFSGGSQGVGAHFEVGSDRIYQLADLDALCWHAVNANAFSVGIEHAGFGRTESEWLDAGHELLFSANRAAWILRHYRLGAPRYGHNIWPHSWGGQAWGGHECPGPKFPWRTWLSMATDAYHGGWGWRSH